MTNPTRRSILVIAIVTVCSYLLSFATPTVYAQNLQGLKKVVIFDANGTQVGRLLDSEGVLVIPFIFGGRVFRVAIKDEGDDYFLGSLFFESTNCSGTPFRRATRAFDIVERVIVAAPNRTIYLTDLDASPRVITGRSELAPFAGGACVESVNPPLFAVVPVIPAVDLDTVFTRPFTAGR